MPHQRGDSADDAVRVVVEVEARDGAVQREEFSLRSGSQVDFGAAAGMVPPPPSPREELLEAHHVTTQ